MFEKLRECFEGLGAVAKQVFRQSPKLPRHFNERILLIIGPMAAQQLHFSTAKITGKQVTLDTHALVITKAISKKGEQSFG
jgi:hypothetical protein